MNDNLNYACTGANPDEALTVLSKVAVELVRRTSSAANGASPDEYSRPTIYLTVDEVGRLADHDGCRRLLEQILRFGRKVGITGEAHGEVVTGADRALVRDLLDAGTVLRYEPRYQTAALRDFR